MVSQGLFFEAPCLTPQAKAMTALALSKTWFKGSDKRYMEGVLQRFVEINKDAFDFLDISTEVVGMGSGLKIIFSTGKFTGAVPLRSPVNGKQIGDLAIYPRFVGGESKYAEYISILNLIESEVLPEYLDSILLSSCSQLRPPLYFHASEYIQTLAKALKLPWRRFQTNTQMSYEPRGVINWKYHFERSFDPSSAMHFKCRNNELSFDHEEIRQLRFVFDLALAQINSFESPAKLRYQLLPQITILQHQLKGISPQKCFECKIHSPDPRFIKEAKSAANEFLRADTIPSKGWRIDFSLVFERFVQFIFASASKSFGLKFFPNYKFIRTSTNNPRWSLAYLEPDGLLMGDSVSAVIDAKYKAHFFNLENSGDFLTDEHRSDLHQILSYSSFLRPGNNHSFLCYPSNTLNYKILAYKNRGCGNLNQVILMGIPLKTSVISDAKLLVGEILTTCNDRGVGAEA